MSRPLWAAVLAAALCLSPALGEEAGSDPEAQREARILFQQGVELQRRGSLSRAADLYRRALEVDPERVEALAFWALALDQEGRSGESLGLYDRYLAIEPDDSTVRLNRAAALVHLARWSEALSALEGLKVQATHLADRDNLRGVALLRSGQAQAAAEAFRSALAVAPERTEPRVNLAAALVVLGEREQAAKELEQVLTRRPQDGPARNNLGVLMAASARSPRPPRDNETPPGPRTTVPDGPAPDGEGDLGPAISAFQQASRNNLPTAELNLVTLVAEQGKLQDALLAVSSVVDRWPRLGRARLLYGIMLYRAARFQEAGGELEQARSLQADSFLTNLYLGLTELARGEPGRATTLLQEAVLALPQAAEGHYDLSLALAARGEVQEALREAEAAESLGAAGPAMQLQLGMLYGRSGRYAEALSRLRAYLALDPTARDRAAVEQQIRYWEQESCRKIPLPSSKQRR